MRLFFASARKNASVHSLGMRRRVFACGFHTPVSGRRPCVFNMGNYAWSGERQQDACLIKAALFVDVCGSLRKRGALLSLAAHGLAEGTEARGG